VVSLFWQSPIIRLFTSLVIPFFLQICWQLPKQNEPPEVDLLALYACVLPPKTWRNKKARALFSSFQACRE
jgi:hypothetical protein